MPAIFEIKNTVSSKDIDSLGHVNNEVYLSWFNEAAMAHSTAQGWPQEKYMALGEGWVVRKHEIEYLIPLKEKDAYTLRTWVSTVEKASSLRRHEITRDSDGKVAARCATLWVWVNYKTGRLGRIPPEVVCAFEVVGEKSQ